MAKCTFYDILPRSISSQPPSQAHPPTDDLTHKKSQKMLILAGASRFNTKPKDGIKFLEENKLIYNDPSISRTRSLALFLKGCTRLDKKLLGDYISKPDNIELLTEFIGLYDFKNVSGFVCGECLIFDGYGWHRNLSATLCGSCWRASDFLERRSRSAGLRRRLHLSSLRRNLVGTGIFNICIV